MPQSLSLFCRLVLGLLFVYSFAAKARDLRRFQGSVTAFRLLPGRFANPLAALVVVSELAAGGLLLAGDPALPLGYALTATLLLLFTGALLVSLLRRLDVGCGCFGRDERPVAPLDLVRNAGFLALVALGWWVREAAGSPPLVVDALVVTLAALSFLLFWTQLAEIVELFGRGAWGRLGPGSALGEVGRPPFDQVLSKEVSP